MYHSELDGRRCFYRCPPLTYVSAATAPLVPPILFPALQPHTYGCPCTPPSPEGNQLIQNKLTPQNQSAPVTASPSCRLCAASFLPLSAILQAEPHILSKKAPALNLPKRKSFAMACVPALSKSLVGYFWSRGHVTPVTFCIYLHRVA
jgi:hypothetical protein